MASTDDEPIEVLPALGDMALSKSVHVRLAEDVHTVVRRRARTHGVSMSYLLNFLAAQAFRDDLEKMAKNAR